MLRIAVTIAGLATLLACATFTPTEPQTCEMDYYRGVYALCMVINAKAMEGDSTRFINCDELVKQAGEKEWYDREVPGFEWPPEEDVSGVNARY